jgi:hypothetical protein
MSDETPLSDAERRALDAWQVPGAPDGFTERVLLRAAAEGRRRTRLVALAAVLLVALSGAAWWLTRGERVTGQALAQGREQHALAERGVAVLEPGAELAWSVEADGRATLVQAAGEVFYRVEPGGEFVVRVPAGEVRVRGTCFGVEVPMSKDKVVSALGGAALGAAVATFVVVTVYEGKVEVARGGEVRSVEPGERAVLGDTLRVEPRRERGAGSAAAEARAEGRPEAPHRAAVGTRMEPAPAAPGDEPAAIAAVRRENERLRRQLQRLEAKAAEADMLRDAHKSYDLSQAELDRMAERCELRWDTIPYRLGEPPRVPGDDAEAFDLSPAQVEAVNALLADENTRLIEAIRAAYGEVMGEELEAIRSVAPEALMSELQDKTPIEERRRIFQTLARERAAGIAPDVSPQALQGMPPVERLLRIVTSSGDRLEAGLAEQLGGEMAREMRDAHKGFGNVHRSSYGCPE